jgi:selT/selW/selH-like putative selenoprotein
MQQFPGLKVEGGPYTPPVAAQYTVRAVRAAQVGVGLFFFLGEQIFASMGKAPPPLYTQMHDNKLITAGGVYALDVVAQTAKSINAFEITYNGQLLHSKLKSGNFPEPNAVAAKLREVMEKETEKQAPSAQ